MTDHLCVTHSHERHIGYGRMGVDLSIALSEIGVDVSDWTEGWEAHITPSEKVVKPGRARTVVFVSPGTHMKGWFEGQRPVAYTMWEATELPEENRELLHEFDQIIVPSEENLKLYSRYHPNVKLVPLGVGPEWHWRPRDPLEYLAGGEMDLPVVDADGKETGERMVGHEVPVSAPEFVVLTAGTSPLRKGFDLVSRAFAKAFPDRLTMSPRPVLMVKSPHGAQVEGVDAFVDNYLSDEEELELYQSAHVYMSLARGEGFGLQPLQAIAQGIPTILVDAHGHESFAHLGLGVAAKLVPARDGEGNEVGYGEDALWWEADVDQAAVLLRHVYDNYAQHVARAERSSRLAHESFSWQVCAAKLVIALREKEALDELGETVEVANGHKLTRPFEWTATWHPTEPAKYLIRVTTEFNGTINGVAYRYEPGQDYYDVADVKRIIARAGFLDQSCVGADGIVRPDKRLSGSYSYCPACHQRLNTQPTKADDLMAARTPG